MSTSPVSYRLADSIAHITMDDGKANVMNERMQQAINAALDRAEADKAVVLLAGRGGFFSGGYDVAMFKRSREEVVRTVRAGGELATRLLSFPYPVVAACTGHAIAQGGFLLLGADVRIGARGAFKFGLNEVVIGLTIPHYGVEIARLRLTPPGFNYSCVTGAVYGPESAERFGFLDRLVAPEDVLRVAQEEALALTRVDMTAHAQTKARVRGTTLKLMREGLVQDFGNAADTAWLGGDRLAS